MTKTSGKKRPATIDGNTLAVLPTPGKIDLKTADDVRLEMAKVYRDMKGGKVDMADGTKLVYVLAQIGKLIELTEIEKRIELLENKNSVPLRPQLTKDEWLAAHGIGTA